MRSLVLTWIIFLCNGPSQTENYFRLSKTNSQTSMHASGQNIYDFSVHRLSGERVMISWHTQGESDSVRFEVMRRHGNSLPFSSVGIVKPDSKEDNAADYFFVDINSYSDSSFYCLKKTNSEGVIFFSITKGVGGTEKDR